jgi:hypothetical protein
MTDHLRSCPECRRHVFERDVECPFCKTKMSGTARALATVAAVAMSALAATGCGDKPVPAVPDGVPGADAGGGASAAPTASTPAVPDVKRGDKSPAPVYGGPPP